MRLKLILNAAKDYNYLLSRNYKRKIALNFVSQHYGLTLSEKMFLLRAVFSEKVVRERRRKTIEIKRIYDNILYIDGFNVLITIMVALIGGCLFLCQDDFIRDLYSLERKIKITKHMYISLEILLEVLMNLKPRKVIFIFDSPVSYSGEFAKYVRNRIKSYHIKGNALTALKTDVELSNKHGIIASSDSLVIDKAKKIVDLAGFIVKYMAPERIINLFNV